VSNVLLPACHPIGHFGDLLGVLRNGPGGFGKEIPVDKIRPSTPQGSVIGVKDGEYWTFYYQKARLDTYIPCGGESAEGEAFVIDAAEVPIGSNVYFRQLKPLGRNSPASPRVSSPSALTVRPSSSQ